MLPANIQNIPVIIICFFIAKAFTEGQKECCIRNDRSRETPTYLCIGSASVPVIRNFLPSPFLSSSESPTSSWLVQTIRKTFLQQPHKASLQDPPRSTAPQNHRKVSLQALQTF
mmetsp:Transcript_32117/g.78043  ORF Transcript_32117/g.78043 Transcript_32117/m.78043 type:complete len:114 (+) Transcript_32117:1062-1403(+)